MWSGNISLLANYASEFHVFAASKIPRWPAAATSPISKVNVPRTCLPTSVETAYVIWMNGHMNCSGLPTMENFQNRSMQAMNVKDKYSLLKDVKADGFYSLIGEVIKVFDSGGRVTLHLSDYTSNSLFYNHVWGGGDASGGPRR
jgi:protection-of-telomeres protein 1